MADSNEQFKIEIISTADNGGFTSTTKAVDGLNSTVTTGARAHEDLAQATKEAGKVTEEAGIPHRELRKILFDIGNQAAPGAGRALGELAYGPIGVALALVSAYELFKKSLEADGEEAEKLGELLGQPFGTSGIEEIKKKWDEASQSLAAYYSAMANAGRDEDAEEATLKRIKALNDAKIESLKKEIAALGEVTIARLRANGANEAQLDAAKEQTRRQLESLDSTKEHADGSGALLKEQRDRTANAPVLDRNAQQAILNQVAADSRFKSDQDDLQHYRNILGMGEKGNESADSKDWQKQKEDAESELEAAKAASKKARRIGWQQDIDSTDKDLATAQQKVDQLSATEQRYRELEARLSASETARTKERDDADAAGKAAKAESERNQARLNQLPGEINQAQSVEREKGFSSTVTDAGKTQLREIAAAHGQSVQEAMAALQQGYLAGQALLKASKESVAAHSEQAGLINQMLAKQRQINIDLQRQIAALTKTAGGG